jgi:hypothetical protein
MEGVQVAKSVEGDSVFGGIVADGGGVAGNFTLCDVICSLGTDEEAITSNDGVSCDSGAL